MFTKLHPGEIAYPCKPCTMRHMHCSRVVAPTESAAIGCPRLEDLRKAGRPASLGKDRFANSAFAEGRIKHFER